MLDNIDELRTFQTVAEKGSLSAAARTLGLSVNAVSRRLAALEEALGLPLAERTTRSLRLTDDGERFLVRCRRIIDEVDDALEELVPGREGLSGLVRAMIHPAMLQTGFFESLNSLLEEHGRLRLHLLTRNDPQDIIRSGADIAVWPGTVELQSVVTKKICSVQWVMACSPSYGERHGLPQKPADLEAHTCLRALRERPERTWMLRDGRGKTIEVTPGGQLDCDDTETLKGALYAGLGIGLRPEGEVARAVAAGKLLRVLPRYGFQILPVHLVSVPGRLRLARVRAVATLLEQAIRSMQ